VAKDPLRAVAWYRRSAEQGDAAAQYNLGNMYRWGEGVARDPEEAIRWFRKAGEQGSEPARKALKDGLDPDPEPGGPAQALLHGQIFVG